MTRSVLRFLRHGKIVELASVPPTLTLLDYLRLQEKSRGTKEGCNEGDCGACTVSRQRSCFLDPIRVEGREDPRQPLLAGIFCVPPTASAGRNSAWGLPGAGEVQLDVRITPGF